MQEVHEEGFASTSPFSSPWGIEKAHLTIRIVEEMGYSLLYSDDDVVW